MKKNIIMISIIAAIAGSLLLIQLNNSETTDDSVATSSIKNKIDQQINQAIYYTIPDATTPSVVIDDTSGRIYAAYFKSENEGGNLYVVSSDDGGKTFSEPVRVNHVKDSVVINAQWSAPGMGVGQNGEVHLVWYDADYSEPDKFPWGKVTLQYARSLDGANTFEPARNPSPDDPEGEQSYPFITISEDNSVHISYLNLDYSKEKDNSGTPTVLRVVSSMDGGQTFEKSVISDHSACQCCATVITMGPDNEVYVSSRSTFLNTVQSLSDDMRTDYHGTHNDKIIIRDITVSHSVDNGMAQVFTEPVKVGKDDWFMNGCPDAGPGMAFDDKERLHIAWFTGSDDAINGQGFYYAYSNDGGNSYSTPIPIKLLSEKWIPPTTQYLVTDNNNNAWIVFVNSEGLKKSPTYDEDYTYIGDGSIHLAIVGSDGNLIRNEALVQGDITKHYPFTSSSGDKIAISWMEGDDVKITIFDTA